MSHALSDTLMRYNPLGAAKDARLQRAGEIGFVVTALLLPLTFVAIPTVLPQDITSTQLLHAFLSILALLISGGTCWSLFAYRARGRRRAVQAWLGDHSPSWEVLARLSHSPEHEAVERKTAAKYLDDSVPGWRLRATALVPVSTLDGVDSKALPQKAPSGRAETVFGVLVAAGGLSIVVCMVLSMLVGQSRAEWVNGLSVGMLFAGMVPGFILLLWAGRKENQLQALRLAQWEGAVLSSFTLDDLLTYQAAPAVAEYDQRQLKKLLNKHYPGWSFDTKTPVWNALCECAPA